MSAQVEVTARYHPEETVSFKSECCAIDAETGLKCRRLAHADVVHRHERGCFVRLAVPGQTHFAARAAVEEAAQRTHYAVCGEDFSGAQLKRYSRKARKHSAHAGVPMTEGGKP